MKNVLKFTVIVLFIVLLKFLLTYTINEFIIMNYNNKIYNTLLIKILYPFNYSESYIVYYNNGNILYKKEKYSEAIEKYKKSIDNNPPESKICDIRINISLSMIKEIDDSYDYKVAYNQLEEAKDNLYKNNCADPIDDNGYSKDAEKLEEEIKDLQNKLNTNRNNSNNKNDNNKQEEKKDDYSQIEEKIKEIEKKSNANRQEEMTKYENMNNDSYYSGKKW